MRQAHYIFSSRSQSVLTLFMLNTGDKIKRFTEKLFVGGDGTLFDREIAWSLYWQPLPSAVSCFPGTRFHVPAQRFSIFFTLRSPGGENGLLRNSFLTICWPAQILQSLVFSFAKAATEGAALAPPQPSKKEEWRSRQRQRNLIKSIGFRRLHRSCSETYLSRKCCGKVKMELCFSLA